MGIDITESMLERARLKLKEKNLTVRLIREDIREFRLNKKFRLIIFPFSAIAHIHERGKSDRWCVRFTSISIPEECLSSIILIRV